MRYPGISVRRVVGGFGVIALALAIYMILRPCTVYYIFLGDLTLVNKAEECRRHGDLDGALRYATRGVQCYPDGVPTNEMRAMILEARGDFRDAIQDYTKVVSLGYDLALADRGRVYEKMGDLDRAATDYCQALRKNRVDFGRLADVRGVALHRVMGPGEYDIDRHPYAVASLLKFFDEAVERDPDNRELRECRELILQSDGR